jgi:hypothetical protein
MKYAASPSDYLYASDMERLRTLADGHAPVTEELLYITLQTLARVALGEPLECVEPEDQK